MSIQSLSALLAALLTFAIAWRVLLRDRRQRRHLTFAILTFNLCGWYLASFLADTVPSVYTRWMSFVVAAAIPSSTERFFLAFLQPKSPRSISRAVWTGTLVTYALLLLGLVYTPVISSLFFRAPLFAFIFGSLAYCVLLIQRSQRMSPSRPEALRLAYLFWGGIIALTLAATEFLPHVGLAFPAVGNILTVIYIYFFSQTLFQYRLLDIKELLSKMVALSALVSILSAIYGLLLVWVGPQQRGIFLFNTVVASAVILVIVEPLRGWLEFRVNRLIFAETYEFTRRLRGLARSLGEIIEERELVTRLLGNLEESGRVTHVSLYLIDSSGARYRLAGHVGPAPVPEIDGTIRRLFLDRLRRTGLLSREGVERRLSDPREDVAVAARNIQELMEELQADVCVPLAYERRMLGILNLRDDRLREAYSSDEIELIRQVAAQAAITLRNSQVYEQMKERDRLAALGQMAAGLAHEIRNPLGAIKGAAQLLDVSPDSTEGVSQDESSEFLEVIIEEVNRLDRVVSQFLGYARPDQGHREMLHLNDVVRKTLQLVRSQHSEEQVAIDRDLVAELPQVRGDPEQLRQVFLNLVINGIQAMGGGGTLHVQTSLRPSFYQGRARRFVEVAFADDGPGIEPSVLKDLFIPFFTTKEGGTGLGLPICQRIIEAHDGLIEVQSEPGKGARFSVLLPAADDGDATGAFSLV
ncbi:MAG: GAF domain-containing protein [Deltaproteobacteria bacterium]|nr:GAF domain-containing protein [Deltaproteobacteria bacterium]